MSVVAAVDRVEGREKVTGQAQYAYEFAGEEVTYGYVVGSTIAKGRIRAVDPAAALALPGVIAVVAHENAGRLHDTEDEELQVLQSARVAYRGQIAAAVVAETYETARQAAALVRIDYDEEPHSVVLSADRPGLYAPEEVNAGFDTDTEQGEPDAALAAAEVALDVTYRTPTFHNNPLEPHATMASWDADVLTLHDSTQGAADAAKTVAKAFGIPEQNVRVISPHVGGGFGSKGTPRPHVVLAALLSRHVGRPVKLAVTRRQMFALTGYRTPTIQRLRLGARRDGGLVAIVHDAVEQSSTISEFAEQTTVVTRMMYAAPNRRTTHRLARLDVPTPSWMRAPGECPGMYGLESAMDELAYACRLDPIELRVRNEPDRDPETGNAWSSRNLVACLRDGAERFGWAERDPAPRTRLEGDWLVGTGVASSVYPARRRASSCRAQRLDDGAYRVVLAASDVGTGGRTVLTQIAAETLDVPVEAVELVLGDSALPYAPLAGGSSGTASWGTAVVKACRALLEGDDDEVTVDTKEDVESDEEYARYAFGAQFAEARVNLVTGEVRVPRLLGVFAAGRILSEKVARSQFVGGMTMGLSMALHEESVVDARFGDFVNHDLAGYHVAANADVQSVEAFWLDEQDEHLNPMGSKGIGEIGIVGTAAAIGNAVFHATGRRFRELPLTPQKLLASGVLRV